MELFLKFMAIAFGVVWAVAFTVLGIKSYHEQRVKEHNYGREEKEHKLPEQVPLCARDIIGAVLVSLLSGACWSLALYAVIHNYYH